MTASTAPLRLRLDGGALLSNWHWLAARSGGAACGAALKANGYGLGAVEVMRRLMGAGCRDFFVSNWGEAAVLEPLLDAGVSLSVLHGVRAEDMARALASRARPVLCSPEQIARWRAAGGGACDVMVDTGMNRLGLDWRDDLSGLTAGLEIETLLSHLASADEEEPFNAVQRDRFAALRGAVTAARYSLANSAGICLGSDYAFDLTRPGIALYGGIVRPEAVGHIRPVVSPQAQLLQRRTLGAGESVGYNRKFQAPRDGAVGILNIGYADGYLRGFSGKGGVSLNGTRLPVLGQVSMDLLAVDVTDCPEAREGAWLTIDYDLPQAARLSGLSQYELLTGLGARFDRLWD